MVVAGVLLPDTPENHFRLTGDHHYVHGNRNNRRRHDQPHDIFHHQLLHTGPSCYCFASIFDGTFTIIINRLSANSHAFIMRSVACSETIPLRLSIM